MKLIIAEKPSVAKTYAAALGIRERKDGYYEGDRYLISWCIGHLAGLADAALYDPRFAEWKSEDLPILPKSWRFVLHSDKKKQFDTLCALMAREDVTEVVNACDAGREGELIFRIVYLLSGCKKPMKRLWLSSMEDEAIRQGVRLLKDGADYDGLYQSALCRMKADWLVGINATRFFTMLYHRKLKVGRVMSPTLAMIVQREAEIRAFVPEPFFTVQLDLGELTVTGEKLKSKKEAAALAGQCKGKSVTIQSITQKEKSEAAPRLYDLTSLQREANTALGYTAQQTLDYAQGLYEKKLCTYPRTDSRFLTDDMESRVPEIVGLAAKICEIPTPTAVNSRQVCDSRKVSDHFAIIPTLSCLNADLSLLPAGERAVLKLIARSVLRAVSGPFLYTETELSASCEGSTFTVKGKTVTDPGWRQFFEKETEDKPLPLIVEGQVLDVSSASVKEGKTAAPKRFTEASLLAAMESAGDKELPEDAEHRGLGTPATRASIIEKLVSDRYLERKKAKKSVQLIPTPLGISLITVLPEQLQSPQLTAEWEQRLKQIERGELSPESFDADIAEMVRDLIGTYSPVDGCEVLFRDSRAVVGKCPRCGYPVIERAKGFFCQNRGCRFALWKDSRFFESKRKELDTEVASALLNDGSVLLTDCFSEKTGKSYNATVFLEDDGEHALFRMVF
ncbi:MAG: DNA topoisomerase 3 [Oscillospiraceae bacterium]|nr:DNA topoisomerase 3 [Oscillospiraceae bacterium]